LIILLNAGYVARKESQLKMKGEAEKSGLKTEEDVAALVDEVREELRIH